MAIDDHKQSCQACLASLGKPIAITCQARGKNFGKQLDFFVCVSCGFTSAPSNTHSYDSGGDFAKTSHPSAKNARVGTDERPGREFHMASMAIEILDKVQIPTAGILFYGAGLSRDHAWIGKKFPGKRGYLTDFANFQEAETFIPLDDPTRFDVVIACEVVEHFTDVATNFSQLLAKVKDSGLLVLSTNINDHGSLSKLTYPFILGHTSYYTGRALNRIAERIAPGMMVDFRVPQAALAQLGPRKRYVLMYRDHTITSAISEYFADHPMAPSEPSVKKQSVKKPVVKPPAPQPKDGQKKGRKGAEAIKRWLKKLS